MRFGEPRTPTSGVTPPDPTGAIQCHQFQPPAPDECPSFAPPGKRQPRPPHFGDPNTGTESVTVTEDCLFLDLYVPASILDNGIPTKKVPVIVYIYGGAFEGGLKAGNDSNNPIFTGVGPINAAAAFNQSAIFVVGNYRLGAFGWLAGSYMEQFGTANAGLYDQRLLLKWVQEYIAQVGGDASQVSAWGESAGASSILHHLVLDGGKLDPLFTKAMIQSPAFEWQ